MGFSKESMIFLRDVVSGSFDVGSGRVLNPDSTVTYIRPRPKSVSHISPGDLFLFNYHGEFGGTHFVLVVQNQRTTTGLFTSTLKNRLLSCFKLSNTSPDVIGIIIENLYKNRKSSYKNVIAGLSAILGKQNYRTYNLSKIGDFSEIEFK